MKKIICLILSLTLILAATISIACVGKTIHLGISSPNEKLMAEMASLIITERTGSTVKIDVYKDSKALYAAVKQGNVNILLENTERANEILGKTKGSSAADLNSIKAEYRKVYNMTWLTPFGSAPQYAPVLTAETLANYPALPKLLNKLTGVLQNDTYPKLLKSVHSEDKTRKVAKDFLKGKKLI